MVWKYSYDEFNHNNVSDKNSSSFGSIAKKLSLKFEKADFVKKSQK
jgi:hypothetical protein